VNRPPEFDSALACVFPGQGSQAMGMLGALAAEHPVVRATFEEGSEAIGLDLWTLAQEGPQERLDTTEFTQPVLLVAGTAVYRVWREMGGARPAAMAGHSLGEYTALVCAGAVSLADATRLARARGRYMQEAVPAGRGSMAAVLGLDPEAVAQLCEQCAGGEVLAPANFNAPGQVVVAGEAGAVARLVAQARGAGARRVLPVAISVPSHCQLMQPAATRLRAALAEVVFGSPQIPVWHNATAAPASGADVLADLLVRQVCSPVLWVQTVEGLAAAGINKLVECGPGRVLTGLNKRIVDTVHAYAAGEPDGMAAALAAVAAGQE